MATLLNPDELAEALGSLPDWRGDGAAISRTVHLGDQKAMDDLLAELESIAREMNHDPDTTITDHNLTITMSTHSSGGVTELDVSYARRVDALLS